MQNVGENFSIHKWVFDFKKSISLPGAKHNDAWAETNLRVFVRINVARVPIMEAIFWRRG